MSEFELLTFYCAHTNGAYFAYKISLGGGILGKNWLLRLNSGLWIEMPNDDLRADSLLTWWLFN